MRLEVIHYLYSGFLFYRNTLKDRRGDRWSPLRSAVRLGGHDHSYFEIKERRLEREKLTRHHRRPTSIGGSDDEANISMVSEKKHQAWHTLFRNMTVFEIAEEINQNFLDAKYQFEVNIRRRKK